MQSVNVLPIQRFLSHSKNYGFGRFDEQRPTSWLVEFNITSMAAWPIRLLPYTKRWFFC